ncbi:hypothetical protein [Neobacillus notoginsengisoli]|nr:hypothetical protein [Neobacillus notoginsengisoli]
MSYASMIGDLNLVIKQNDLLSFNYDRSVYRNNHAKQFITEDSVVTFDLSPNFIEPGTVRKVKKITNFEKLTHDEQINAIIGNTYGVQVRCHNDFFNEIISYPARITNIEIHDDELLIEGSNHLYIKTKGFVRLRYTGDLLFDIYNDDGGYTRTIHLSA